MLLGAEICETEKQKNSPKLKHNLLDGLYYTTSHDNEVHFKDSKVVELGLWLSWAPDVCVWTPVGYFGLPPEL